MSLTYLTGDATAPHGTGARIIAHVCNDIGAWGAGFVLAVSRRWSLPEEDFRRWYREGQGFSLGAVRIVPVEPSLYVANMIGQNGIRRAGGLPPIRYDALETCLLALAERAVELSASVHMPRIGCGLAGGKWEKVEPLIVAALVAKNVDVTVYDLPV